MKYCLIVNPYSRGGKGRALAERCVRYLADRGCPHDTKIVEEFGQACTLSRTANLQGYDVVVAVGGDGTLNRVLNGFYDACGKRISEAKLGVLHTGTSPDFCKSYNVPLDLQEAVEALVRLRTRTVPIGRIRCAERPQAGCQGRRIDELPAPRVAYFGCCANIGLGAALARKANSGIRKYLGDSAGTFLSLLQVLHGYRAGTYDILRDGTLTSDGKVFNVSVGLTRYIASGIRSYKDNMAGRNRFYVMTLRNVTLRVLPSVLAKIYRGREFENTEYLSMSEAESIEILGTDVNPEVEFDGDPAGYLPCSIDLARDELELIC